MAEGPQDEFPIYDEWIVQWEQPFGLPVLDDLNHPTGAFYTVNANTTVGTEAEAVRMAFEAGNDLLMARWPEMLQAGAVAFHWKQIYGGLRGKEQQLCVRRRDSHEILELPVYITHRRRPRVETISPLGGIL